MKKETQNWWDGLERDVIIANAYKIFELAL